MSSKPVNTVGSKPAPPVAAAPRPACPKRSYKCRLSASASTAYASAASLNFSSAALSPGLRSGWNLSASLRYELLISWSLASLRDGQGPRSSRACSRVFRHLYHRRTQQTVAEHVTSLQLLHDLAFAVVDRWLHESRPDGSWDRSRSRALRSAARRACEADRASAGG